MRLLIRSLCNAADEAEGTEIGAWVAEAFAPIGYARTRLIREFDMVVKTPNS
jgi:hypothetical protein